MGQILITGGTGFLGMGVAHALLTAGTTHQIVLNDIAAHPRAKALLDSGKATLAIGDLGDAGVANTLVRADTVAVYHFASLVSGGAEKDFAAGLKANVHATINLFEACRTQAKCPRLVFASSIATFGGAALGSEAHDLTHQHPQSSYGVAKVIGEQLLNDYSRKGFMDARGVRLPAVIVRDEPNTAASGYASGLIREPAAGKAYVCPVPGETRIPIISVETTIKLLVALGALDGAKLGDWRTINAPGLTPSAAEIAAAVSAALPKAAISYQVNPQVLNVLSTWPKQWRAERAAKLGLPADRSIADIVAAYLASQRAGAASA